MKHALFIISMLLLFAGNPAAQDSLQTDYFTKENILRFADYLYENGEYARAAGEYARVMVLCGDAKLEDTLAFRIAVANIKLSKSVPARKYCASIPADLADSLLGARAACLNAYSYYIEKKFDSASLSASLAFLRTPEAEWQLRSAQINVGALIQRYRWHDAAIEAERVMELYKGKRNDTLLRHLRDAGLEGTKLSLKNAGLAGFISAIVPGIGKVYAGKALDGAYSFLLIGLMAWQSYEGYRKDGLVSGRCITFGLLGTAFYAGNIYGSVNAAQLCNRSRRRALCDRINLQFDWQVK